MIFAAFGGLAIYLFAQGRLFEPEALSILGVVFAYFFGTIARMALHWWTKGKQTHAVRGWQDIKALVVIAVLAYTAADYLLNPGHPPSTGLRNTTLGMVLFYFGSR
jgi:ABC-type Fe3+-siderophore transport system permease subunit